MPASDRIKQLVERFEQHREAYRAGKYNETQLRNEFLNPFFEALGWDVLNKLGYSEENKHVIHEDSLEIEGAKKAPDYAFKVGKERKFFVEAKKPSVRIETNPEVAFQLKRYVWSAKLPLGILTDFEEFAIYECRSKPKVSDSVKTGRVLLLNYTDYIEKWDEIVSIFSHDAVMTGGFDKFANSAAKKKGTAEVDSAFLAEIEGWREALAKNVALRNKPKVKSEADLNYAVQMTIDRMIFLRICEDRGYESEYQLQEISKRENVYDELKKLFERADRRYNSGLFHFKDERGRGRADTFTTGLEIDDKVLKDIIKDLYYPAPYVFALIPADILGQIYEQFLGKVIRLTAGGNAKVEEKPEVRKAGGVYYTPTFIVDTIVGNTIGRLVIGKLGIGMTPKEVTKLKLVDPACGSGTFLLGAYQYLLDWHLNWYMNNDFEKWSKGKNAVLVQSKDSWKLSVEKKKEILLNNIYGVDIDPQAVEVTKLSLLLKVIEDPGQLSYLDERILPDLGRNIQCGNSLIGSDYFEGQLGNGEWLMGNGEERARVNAFDWKAAFPEVFTQGGFDAVIGNPPYVFGGNYGIEQEAKKYFKEHFFSGAGKINLFTLFIEKSTNILRDGGLLSFIIPNTLLRVTSYGEIREFMLKQTAIKKIIDMGVGVFSGATTSSVIIVLEKNNEPVENKVEIRMGIDGVPQFTLQSDFLTDGYVLNIKATGDDSRLSNKMGDTNIRLGELCEELIFGVVITKNRDDVVTDKPINGYKPFLEGKDISRYLIRSVEKYLLYQPDLLHRPRTPRIFEAREKIMIQRITGGARPLNATYDDHQYYNKESINNIILKNDTQYNVKYVLGLINSRLLNWFYKTKFTNGSTLTVNLSKEYLSQLPIRPINFSDPAEKAQHDKMVSLVERMLALQKSLKSTHNPQEADRLTREVESVDKSIDGLVYELYGLTEEEVKIVEGGQSYD